MDGNNTKYVVQKSHFGVKMFQRKNDRQNLGNVGNVKHGIHALAFTTEILSEIINHSCYGLYSLLSSFCLGIATCK